MLVRIFAAMSVSCYYWYRVPALFGFGNYADDGLLVDLTTAIPVWLMTILKISVVTFFFYWLVVRDLNKKNWALRPQFAKK
jgi:hypothetical protein